MEAIFGRLAENYLDNVINITVYIGILALLLLSFIKCVLPVWRTRALLRRAIRNIKAGEKSKRSWQEDTFLGKGALYPHWSEYLDNLFFADGEYHNASNVEDYINEETVISQPGRSALSAAAPGLMVSLGFLGTLLGITQGLAGFSMDNSEAVMQAIRTLIPGMKYAFTTSVVGVVCSILFTVCTSVVNGAARNTLSDFYAAMHNNAGVLTVDPLNQIAIYQQEQTAQIQAIAADITGAMTQRMADVLQNTVEPVRQTLDSFCRYTTRQQTQALDTVLSRFLDRMDESLHGQFKNLSVCIHETVDWQRKTQQNVEEMLGSFERATRDVAEIQRATDGILSRFEEYISKLSAAQGLSEEAYQRIASNVGQMEIVSSQQTATLQAIAKLQGELSRAVAEQRAATEEQTRSIAGTLGAIEQDLKLSADTLRGSGEALVESHKAFVSGVNEDLEKTYNAFFADIGETTRQLDRLVHDVQLTIERLPDVLDAASNLFADQGDRLTGAIKELRQTIDEQK
ncbi:MAG: MotA/TolQ/ExbB proton channel family protein [Eubacteriales bacterium]|nr:MotA/TolQ/ExbB proton channel family protein [Eubacteriales bacterium]